MRGACPRRGREVAVRYLTDGAPGGPVSTYSLKGREMTDRKKRSCADLVRPEHREWAEWIGDCFERMSDSDSDVSEEAEREMDERWLDVSVTSYELTESSCRFKVTALLQTGGPHAEYRLEYIRQTPDDANLPWVLSSATFFYSDWFDSAEIVVTHNDNVIQLATYWAELELPTYQLERFLDMHRSYPE